MYEKRIAKGIAFLDKKRPGWCEKIDLEMLDLKSRFQCVLGQVDGEFDQAVKKFGWKAEFPGVIYGFNLNAASLPFEDRINNWNILTEEWKKAISEHCQKVME